MPSNHSSCICARKTSLPMLRLLSHDKLIAHGKNNYPSVRTSPCISRKSANQLTQYRIAHEKASTTMLGHCIIHKIIARESPRAENQTLTHTRQCHTTAVHRARHLMSSHVISRHLTSSHVAHGNPFTHASLSQPSSETITAPDRIRPKANLTLCA